jgi:hypothetical protein
MASRWDFLLDQKPVPLAELLLDEVSKLLAKDLAGWPLPIQELDAETGRRFQPLLEPESQRPGEPVFAEAFRLTRWEIERNIDAIDEYMRNQTWSEHGLTAEDKLALLFVSRWLVEQLLSLREAVEGRISRPQLVDCLERARRRLRRPEPEPLRH